jgi:GNAT superfamily N-acetyltransferase
MNKTDALTLDTIEDRRVTAGLDRAIRDILVACFPADAEHFSRDRSWNSRPSWVTVARTPDGGVAAHCAMVERGVLVNGAVAVTVAGVQGFSVVPEYRGLGLSGRLMEHALAEARRRGIDAGLLFCLPALETVYGRMGWRRIDAAVVIRDESGKAVPLPEKNIAMAIMFSAESFPSGDIDLRGPDW